MVDFSRSRRRRAIREHTWVQYSSDCSDRRRGGGGLGCLFFFFFFCTLAVTNASWAQHYINLANATQRNANALLGLHSIATYHHHHHHHQPGVGALFTRRDLNTCRRDATNKSSHLRPYFSFLYTTQFQFRLRNLKRLILNC